MIFYRCILLLPLFLTYLPVAHGAPAPGVEPEPAGHAAQRVYRAAMHGRDAAAMYTLGNMLEHGIGMARDDAEAFSWYYRAAELGNNDAMNCLGIAYATGQGVPRNYALALLWFFKAADKGSIQAMNNIAKTYYLGAGVPVGYPEAARWFELAARNGDPGAMNNLAVMYENGTGVTRDADAAVALFARSARHGYAPAMMNLGVLYANGESVKQDDALAYAWMESALEAGLDGEERNDVAREVGILAARLSASELTRARKLSGEILAVVMRPPPQSRRDAALPRSLL